MISVKPQTNTQIIELDVQADSPFLAVDLANQVSQSFAQYTNASAPNTVHIIPAQVPTLPAQPHPLEDAGIGAGVGLLLMLSLIVVFEWVSNRTTSIEQIQELLGAEILMVIPRFKRRMKKTDLQQGMAEKYLTISASLNIAQTNKAFKVVIFTSALAGEGKSTVISNVARNLARVGKRVLLVDFNIHRPAQAEYFHLENRSGLTDLLARGNWRLQLEVYSQATAFPGLSVLTNGTQQMNSSELLQALEMTQFFARLKQSAFDYILLDAPPLFAVAETRVLLSLAEALVLVVDGSHTPRRVLERTRQLLGHTQAPEILGVVVNQSSLHDDTHAPPYGSGLSATQHEPSFLIEQVTVELPSDPVKLLQAPDSGMGQREMRWPDTGEAERIKAGESTRYVIRPSLSLIGLTFPKNGLLRGTSQPGAAPDTPPFFQQQ
jgi:capsular exopolysaccharide synthesis family protein